MKLECKKCGLKTTEHKEMIDAIKELSCNGCTWSIGFRTWCRCGAIDSFKKDI